MARREAGRAERRRAGRTSFGEDAGEMGAATRDPAAVDPAVRRAAREIAARLASARPPARRPPRDGSGEILSVPYRGGGGEIDLDRTLEAILPGGPRDAEDILVRERRRLRRAIVLAVDVSGSMRGARLHTAAATVGALGGELSRDDLAVIAFWSDAAVLLDFGERATTEELVDGLLGLKAAGLTNVAFPLEVAAERLRGAGVRERRAVLLSDCVHNAGPDPRRIAASLPRLDVLLDASGEQDAELAADLARVGRGLLRPIRTYRDAAPALTAILAG